MNHYASKMISLLAGGGIPKRLIYLILKAGGKEKEAAIVLNALKNPSSPANTLAWKPMKLLAENLLKQNGKIIAGKITKVTTPIMTVYGTVLAVVEVECCIHCIGKNDYDPNNGLKVFNVDEAVNFYLGDIDIERELATDPDIP